MFTWLKQKFQDLRIATAFPAYEAAMRAEHVNVGLRRFSTFDLEREIAHCMKIPLQEMRALFSDPIEELHTEIRVSSSVLDTCRGNLAVFDRPYKEELDPLYDEKKHISDQLSVLHDQKNDAYARLKHAQSDVDAWHAKSKRSFFGNGSKRLPSHSMFGQSFGDLDGYKAHRSAAFDNVKRYSSEIDSIKVRRDKAGERIGAIKADRQRMFDLREKGVNPGKLKNTIRETEIRLAKLETVLMQTERKQDVFLEAARYRTGVIAREREIARITMQHDQFKLSFDQEQAHAARKHDHRVGWLSQHR